MTLPEIEYMRALASGVRGARPSTIDTMGMSAPLDLVLGEAAVMAEPADFLLNPMGAVHDGFAATHLDSVMGIAVHTALEPATGYATAELKINFTRAIIPTTGRLRADCGPTAGRSLNDPSRAADGDGGGADRRRRRQQALCARTDHLLPVSAPPAGGLSP